MKKNATILGGALIAAACVSSLFAIYADDNAPLKKMDIPIEGRKANDAASSHRDARVLPYGMTAPEKVKEFISPAPLPVLKAEFVSAKDPIWLYGNVTSTYEPSTENLIGIYRYQLNSSTPNAEKVYLNEEIRGFSGGGGWTPEGYHLVIPHSDTQSATHSLYDLNTWELIRRKEGPWLSQINSSAWDYFENKQSVLAWSADPWALHDLCHFEDMVDFNRTQGYPIYLRPGMLRAHAIDTDGTIYAIDYSANLYTIDRHSGELTLIGNCGRPSPFDTSMYVDPLTHNLYYIANNQKTELYILNKKTAQATLVWEFPHKEQIFGLYSNSPFAYDKSPAMPENMKFERPDDELSGKITFRISDKNYDGTAASGNVDYTLVINRVEMMKGTSAAGSTVSLPVSLAKAGYYTFVVYTGNETGNSPYAVSEEWVGPDTPVTIAQPQLSYDGQTMKLKWDAVTESQHGGHMPLEDVTYDVIRHPGSVQVATDIKATEFTEQVSETIGKIEAYSYDVRANYKSQKGEFVESNRVVVGIVEPAYNFTFATEDEARRYTVIDANNDGFSWKMEKGVMINYYNNMDHQDADDWLMTSAINVQKGKAYKVKLDICGHNENLVQKFEVRAGTSPTVEGMTLSVVNLTELNNDNSWYGTTEGWLVPEKDGTVYLGIHAMGEWDSYYIYLHKLSIEEGIASDTPAAADDFTVYTSTQGMTYAEVHLTAPTHTTGGTPLEAIEKIEVYRESKLLKTIENPVPGESIVFTEKSNRTGDFKFRAIAYNAEGAGMEAVCDAYIGYAVPGNVRAVRADITQGDEIMITWDAPLIDFSGKPINPAIINYELVDNDGNPIAENLTGNSYSLPVDNTVEQNYTTYVMRARTTPGVSEYWTRSNIVPVGKPISLPFVESISNCTMKNDWRIFKIKGAGSWGIADDSGDVMSQDYDNGMFVFNPYYKGDKARLVSGKIELGESLADLTLWYFCDTWDSNYIEVQVNDGTGWNTLHTIQMQEGTDLRWMPVSVDLSEYVGKKLQIGFLGTMVDTKMSMIDNISIRERAAYDLEVNSFITPDNVIPGQKWVAKATVTNVGGQKSGNYTVELRRNGEAIEFIDAQALTTGESADFTFEMTPDMETPESERYTVTVEYPEDMNMKNNTSEVHHILLRPTPYPVPEGISYNKSDESFELKWERPDYSTVKIHQIVDTAEDYVPFSMGTAWSEVSDDTMGDWIIYDGDRADKGGFTIGGSVYPHPNLGQPGAFIVFDTTDAGLSTLWNGNGNSPKCFMSMFSPDSASDDWMISPLLSGKAQTISLYAKSYSADYPESFEILYSAGGADISEFAKLGESVTPTNEYAKYEFELPEGARRFAIRCVSDDKFALMIDDISFTAGNDENSLPVIGYNVYRDGHRVNDILINGNSYTETDVPAVGVRYNVTAVYGFGESRMSAPVIVSESSVDNLAADKVKVSVEDKRIDIQNPEGETVCVYSATGLRIGGGNTDFSIGVESGVYLVRTNRNVIKVIVR